MTRRAEPGARGGRTTDIRRRSGNLSTQTATAPAAEIAVATRSSDPARPRQPGPPGRPAEMPSIALLLAWALGCFVVGAIVASGISFTRQGADLWPVFFISILFSEVVGFTALLSARLLFPLFERLPYTFNLALQIFTLFSGTLFGSVMILTAQPYFALARLRTVAVIVLVNGILAVIVGIALYTYDSMRLQIEAQYRALREKEAMERELAIAREVQRELLPRACPVVPGLLLSGACRPAVGVGGDYYDYLQFSEDRLGLVIADVAGKGIPAALLMAGLQASVRSLAGPAVEPGEVNRRLNSMLYRSTSTSRYATLFFAVYDARKRLLHYSNAGHFPPLHLSRDGVARLTADGIPLGLMEEARYGQAQRTLVSGDLLAMYTDGIVEAPDARGIEFGEDRLVDVLRRHDETDLDELVLLVMEELSRWTGGSAAHDDATLVLVRAT
jgi:serine phosphatase RsbU (regulator of sigma subunit)